MKWRRVKGVFILSVITLGPGARWSLVFVLRTLYIGLCTLNFVLGGFELEVATERCCASPN